MPDLIHIGLRSSLLVIRGHLLQTGIPLSRFLLSKVSNCFLIKLWLCWLCFFLKYFVKSVPFFLFSLFIINSLSFSIKFLQLKTDPWLIITVYPSCFNKKYFINFVNKYFLKHLCFIMGRLSLVDILPCLINEPLYELCLIQTEERASLLLPLHF